jgi:hypothetical protein
MGVGSVGIGIGRGGGASAITEVLSSVSVYSTWNSLDLFKVLLRLAEGRRTKKTTIR